MKQIITTILFILLPVIASAQLSVGVMNPDEVLNALPETAQVESEIEGFIEQTQSSFQADYQSWINDLTQFSQQVEEGQLSEEEQTRQEERLAERQETLNSRRTRMQQQIQQRQSELFNPLLSRVEQAMGEVSEEMGLDFVINKTSNTGDPIVYFSSQRGVDITERVIEKLTQN
jgi:outer membrane protein